MHYIEIEAIINNFAKIESFIINLTHEIDVSVKVKAQIFVALEEVFVNICKYAYGREIGKCKIGASVANKILEVEFRDYGTMFNPLNVKVDTTLPLEKRKIGGLGIHIVKNTMTNLKYEYRNNQNIFSFSKQLCD